MNIICEFCGKESNKFGIKNHIEIVHLKTRNGWNKGLTKETDDRVKRNAEAVRLTMVGRPGRPHTEETKKKISISKLGNTFANKRVDRQNYFNGVRMDSKWEVGVAIYLTEAQIEWKYNEKGFKLSDGRTYYPDFFIYENGNFNKLIEVKGYFRDENKIKFDLFCTNYSEISVELWDKHKLKELGIINVSGYVLPNYSVDGGGLDCKSAPSRVNIGGSNPSCGTKIDNGGMRHTSTERDPWLVK